MHILLKTIVMVSEGSIQLLSIILVLNSAIVSVWDILFYEENFCNVIWEVRLNSLHLTLIFEWCTCKKKPTVCLELFQFNRCLSKKILFIKILHIQLMISARIIVQFIRVFNFITKHPWSELMSINTLLYCII